MALFSEVAALIPTLRGHLAPGACADDVQATISAMTDAEVVAVIEEAVDIAAQVEQLKLVAVGIAATRSPRDQGHAGLAQSRGRRSAVDLVQSITGSTKGEAAREVRVGLALMEEPEDASTDAESAVAPVPAAPWHEPLRAALQEQTITTAQYDVIRGGLGEPPVAEADAAVMREAWSCAAEQLIAEAPDRTVEELRAAARALRDLLDPDGAAARFAAQYEARSLRTYRDSLGRRRGDIVFDEESGAFFDAIMASALRPRRGGPRFVDPDEKAQAASLIDDPRSNDQLAFDLLMDVVRAGVLAEPEAVFGTRQAGVRLVQVVDSAGAPAPTAHTEDGLTVLPSATAGQRICESGTTLVTLDGQGNPLDVGREHRLFTPAQRVALAIRDGGCRWHGCDRPASYCEAHHIDEWSGGGRTDIDRGILLCRYHHMTLHHGRWRITRERKDDFVLHHPDGDRHVLKPRAVLLYAWGGIGIDPPPKRFRPAA
ncbi:HNH endonuclease signature motif containing protein [Microbacterium sp. CIAB417]|uniref:HNH endonuclease signature motif containing protein n=1 Tax=Microbacterium sp. CIAB417 TaxID=2860287 RepID=UPI001FAD1FAE|nr:HNH endonuclease signature motif containing protein [Microbacterium sp. CIAB417]